MPKRPSSTTSSTKSTTSSEVVEICWFKLGTEHKQEKKPKNLKQLLDSLPSDHPYNAIKAPISLLPRNKYCDVTGLEGRHTDPKTNLRYHDASVYQLIEELAPPNVQAYLQVRNAAIILK